MTTKPNENPEPDDAALWIHRYFDGSYGRSLFKEKPIEAYCDGEFVEVKLVMVER